MAQGKKYDIRVTENDGSWTAEIVRKISTRKTKVTKRQDGFGSEAEAQSWGEETLNSFLQQQVERNQRKAAQRTEREAQALRQAAKAEQKRAERAAAAEADDADYDDYDDEYDD
ncbi:DUF3622 domain-containing protein [Ferrimonas balearica]|uniref:DUF3622 domain-containing protein n=1 Tax=Ferrimonas balearica TaxID=44012 RepID=UPI001C93FD99|nr:DUF3622 domain-containing protein [Ferrimonas balearica]MBY5981351.1 DUF3622 domain-containing protein [Ferrimonas balearica]MBY6018745.1 DUF3622 domain-containing protein [Halomonas denitrificans]MBY6095935.1 DUF3622 domain-containing protein [Ferrimonas balearica]